MFYKIRKEGKLAIEQPAKINRILTALEAITDKSDIGSMGSGIHPLKGEYKGFWSI